MGTRLTDGSARLERCAILCARIGPDASPERVAAVRVILNGLDTDGWWFVNPGTFIMAFICAKTGSDRAKTCQAALRRTSESSLPLGLGYGEGELVCVFANTGNLASMPMGAAVNDAIAMAAGNAS
jgi:hypothetical protein